MPECPGAKQLWLQGREGPREGGREEEDYRKDLRRVLKSGSSTNAEDEIKTASP